MDIKNTADAASLCRLKNVGLVYHGKSGETQALSDVTFDVRDKEFLSIVGSSGCGKSTVLSIMSGLLPPTSGTVTFPGGRDGISQSDVGYMLQHDHLFPWTNVMENACTGLKIKKKNTPENRERVKAMLREYGLYEFRDRLPRELSGGMRQRAALVRTLALEPRLLLLDEPFSALDYQTRIRVSGDIASIIRKTGKTAVMVTHDISEAISLSDRVIVLSRRPARVRRVIDIALGGEGISKRKSPAFSRYFDLIWEELNNE